MDSASASQTFSQLDSQREARNAEWEARRSLARALRALTEACVTTASGADELQRAARIVEDLSTELGRVRSETMLEALQRGTFVANAAEIGDRNCYLGLSNPRSPPLTIAHDGHRILATTVLGYSFEGAPSMVHGGQVAGIFDQVFGSLMVREGHPALTGHLEISYRSPTPIRTPLTFAGWIRKVDGRRVLCEGDLVVQGTVAATAKATMIRVEHGMLRALFAAAEGQSQVGRGPQTTEGSEPAATADAGECT